MRILTSPIDTRVQPSTPTPKTRASRKNKSAVRRPRVNHTTRRLNYLRAAARVLLEKGLGASMQDIADGAGAPKPVFYRAFASRADLMNALFQHVHDQIVLSQEGEWDGYGWALRMLYQRARQDPEIFRVVLTVLRGEPALEEWRSRLMELIHAQTVLTFLPAPDAPPGGKARAIRASRTMSTLAFDTLVSWLEERDGLTDEQRFRWWARIVREWRKATREAFRLDSPDKVR
jgi:AcrR family transcriptional regulator